MACFCMLILILIEGKALKIQGVPVLALEEEKNRGKNTFSNWGKNKVRYRARERAIVTKRKRGRTKRVL